MTVCGSCGNCGGMAPECVECCVRWLSGMTQEQLKANAHMIERMAGAEQMEKVRLAWKAKR